MVHLIPNRRSDSILINKKQTNKQTKKQQNHRVKLKENEKRDKNLVLARERENNRHVGDGDNNCN